MNKETLKKWRLIIPGIIIIILLLPSFTNSKKELLELNKVFQSFKWSDLYYIAAILILGAIYYTLNLRWILWKPLNRIIQNNIKDKLLNSIDISLTAKEWYKIKKGRTLMTMFYSFVDNDESLKEKAKGVRFNGIIWTSFIDFSILSLIAAFVYSLLSFFTSKKHFIYIGDFLFILFFIFLIFSWLLTYRHLKLSNEQLEVIIETKKKEVETKINEIIE